MATHVRQMLEHLYEISEGTGAPQGLRSSLLHHKKRLDKNHNMRLWKQVMWFRPSWIVRFGRPCQQEPISVAAANNLFDDQASEHPIFSITEVEGSTDCDDYGWDSTVYEYEYQWWCSTGKILSPSLFVVARHYLWIPVVVMKCDSMLSILSYMTCHVQFAPSFHFPCRYLCTSPV